MKGNGVVTLSEFSKLTTTLFSAALGQTTWNYFLSDLSAQAGDICTHLVGFDLESGVTISPILQGYDPSFIASYENYYGDINSWAPGFSEQEVGVAIDSEVMCPMNRLVKTEFYNDWVLPQENVMQGGGALLFKNDTRVFALGGNIRLKDTEKLKKNWLRLIELLIPHAQQAVEVNRALAGHRLETAVVANENLREVPAIVMLSEAGKVVYANSIAHTMLSKGDPISVDRRGSLSFRDGAQGQRITQGFLRHKLNAASPSFTLQVSGAMGSPTYTFRFIKLTPEAQIAFPFDATLGFSSHCLLLVVTKQAPKAHPLAKLKARYSLTEAEIDVAILLTEGLTNSQIAERRGRSVATVHAQVRSMLSKTDCSTRTQFARLALELDEG